MGNLCVKKKDPPHSVSLPNNINADIPVDSPISFESDKEETKCQMTDRSFSKQNASSVPSFPSDGFRSTNNCKYMSYISFSHSYFL